MTTTVLIQNLKCGGCAHTIIKNLETLEDVSQLEVDVENERVSYDYNNPSTVSQVEEKLRVLGYPIIGNSNTYFNKAKSFISCATGKLNQ
jgi:copper chaperone CopZ